MTFTMQFTAPANVATTTGIPSSTNCVVKYKLKNIPTACNYIKPKINMAYIYVLISLSGANFIFLTKQLTPTLCELTVKCAFSGCNKVGGGELIEHVAQIFSDMSDQLEQQGYI
ncbi:MAG: hypothetical protein RR528_06620 [Angelakisella sp.]